MGNRIQIDTVSGVCSPLFRDSFALYRRVFPADEQMPKRYFHEHLAEKNLGLSRPYDFHYLVARSGDRVLGFGCSTYLALVNMGFIDYLAVDRDVEGQGVGSRLRQGLVEAMRGNARRAGRHDLTAVLGEVRQENPWLRRLLAKGAFALDIDYRQPPLGPHKGFVPLVLYVEPIGEVFDRLPVLQVRQLLYALYRRLYRIRYPLQDPNFRFMLKQIARRDYVGARKLV